MKVAFYKGTRPKLQGVFNRLVRWWTNGPYSHVEIVLGISQDNKGMICWSSSGEDGGVRCKVINLHPDRWDIVDIGDIFPNHKKIESFFDFIKGSPYDTKGILGFIWRAEDGEEKSWFCSECVAAALEFHEPWRFDPNSLYAVIMTMKRNHGASG